MTGPQVEQLSLLLERANRRLRERLQGMTDEEYLWEPVADCWTVRRRETATSATPFGRGEWVFDNAEAAPSPAPFTTIAWRLNHLIDVVGGYGLVLRGEGERVTADWIEVPPTAAGAVALWDRQATAFAQDVAREDDESLQRSVRAHWWPEEAPRWMVIANVITEATHHGAEIGVLRDLYARRDELRG